MIRLVWREWIKLTMAPATRWVAAVVILLQVYAYWRVAANYSSTAHALTAHLHWLMSRLQGFVSHAPPTDPLRSSADVISVPMVVTYNLAILCVFGPFFAAIVGAQSLGGEYSYRTIRLLWTEGSARGMILASKLISLSLLLLIGMVGVCTFGLGMSVLFHAAYHIPWVAPPTLPSIGLQWLVTWLGLMLWTIFAGSVAALARSRLAGILVGIGYPIAETLVDPWAIRVILPLWNQKSTLPIAFKALGEGGVVAFPQQPHMVSLWMGIGVSALYIAGLCAALYLLWHWQEVRT